MAISGIPSATNFFSWMLCLLNFSILISGQRLSAQCHLVHNHPSADRSTFSLHLDPKLQFTQSWTENVFDVRCETLRLRIEAVTTSRSSRWLRSWPWLAKDPQPQGWICGGNGTRSTLASFHVEHKHVSSVQDVLRDVLPEVRWEEMRACEKGAVTIRDPGSQIDGPQVEENDEEAHGLLEDVDYDYSVDETKPLGRSIARAESFIPGKYARDLASIFGHHKNAPHQLPKTGPGRDPKFAGSNSNVRKPSTCSYTTTKDLVEIEAALYRVTKKPKHNPCSAVHKSLKSAGWRIGGHWKAFGCSYDKSSQAMSMVLYALRDLREVQHMAQDLESAWKTSLDYTFVCREKSAGEMSRNNDTQHSVKPGSKRAVSDNTRITRSHKTHKPGLDNSTAPGEDVRIRSPPLAAGHNKSDQSLALRSSNIKLLGRVQPGSRPEDEPVPHFQGSCHATELRGTSTTVYSITIRGIKKKDQKRQCDRVAAILRDRAISGIHTVTKCHKSKRNALITVIAHGDEPRDLARLSRSLETLYPDNSFQCMSHPALTSSPPDHHDGDNSPSPPPTDEDAPPPYNDGQGPPDYTAPPPDSQSSDDDHSGGDPSHQSDNPLGEGSSRDPHNSDHGQASHHEHNSEHGHPSHHEHHSDHDHQQHHPRDSDSEVSSGYPHDSDNVLTRRADAAHSSSTRPFGGTCLAHREPNSDMTTYVIHVRGVRPPYQNRACERAMNKFTALHSDSGLTHVRVCERLLRSRTIAILAVGSGPQRYDVLTSELKRLYRRNTFHCEETQQTSGVAPESQNPDGGASHRPENDGASEQQPNTDPTNQHSHDDASEPGGSGNQPSSHALEQRGHDHGKAPEASGTRLKGKCTAVYKSHTDQTDYSIVVRGIPKPKARKTCRRAQIILGRSRIEDFKHCRGMKQTKSVYIQATGEGHQDLSRLSEELMRAFPLNEFHCVHSTTSMGMPPTPANEHGQEYGQERGQDHGHDHDDGHDHGGDPDSVHDHDHDSDSDSGHDHDSDHDGDQSGHGSRDVTMTGQGVRAEES